MHSCNCGNHQQLAQGNLNVRVDTDYNRGEFAVLIQSIDEMAEALSNREAERLAAEAMMMALPIISG